MFATLPKQGIHWRKHDIEIGGVLKNQTKSARKILQDIPTIVDHSYKRAFEKPADPLE